jgi:molybdopterin/thiamine biosynthesis adenylyltransferase
MTGRYARHGLIDWFDQDLIRRQRLVVVGAGAVGNEIIKNLVLLGVGELHIFDRDAIEIHNLTRSVLFRDSDVGRPKAACAAARARELDPNVEVVSYHGDFWETLTFTHLERTTAVFSAVDNFEARVKLNRLCALARVALINVAIDSRFASVEHFPFGSVPGTACYECGLPPSAYTAIARRYSCGWLRRIGVAEQKVPTTILTSSAAASLGVSLYLRSLVDGSSAGSARCFHDTFTGESTRSEIGRRDGCPGCSDLRDTRVIVRARRTIASSLAQGGLCPGAGPLAFSDRVVTLVRCRTCHAGEAPEIIFGRAGRFDERLAECPRCRQRSREIELRDQFSADELLRDYSARSVPGKYVICVVDDVQVVVELEGADHVGSDGDRENGRSDAEGGSDDPARPAGV